MATPENQYRLLSGLVTWLENFFDWLLSLSEWLNTPITLGGDWFVPEFEITPLGLVCGTGIIACIIVAITKTFIKWW